MLIYEKEVNGTRHIFGSTSNVPTENDEQVLYLDDSRKPVTVTSSSRFRCAAGGKMVDQDGHTVNVWINENKSIIPIGLESGVGSACDILSFTVKIKGDKCVGVINEAATPNPTIAIAAPAGSVSTDLEGLKPVIKKSPESTVSPASGASQTFVSGTAVNYTVTAEDTTHTKTYKVTITLPE